MADAEKGKADETRTYPASLRKGWAERDGWRAQGLDRSAPRPFRRAEAFLLRAERAWRYGADDDQVDKMVNDGFSRLAQEMDRWAPRRVEPRSLAQARFQWERPSAPLFDALKTAVEKLAESPKPEGIDAAAKELSAKFSPQIKKDRYPFALADAAIRLAVDSNTGDGQRFGGRLIVLDRILHPDGSPPLYAETLVLNRLAKLAAAPPAWDGPTLGRALKLAVDGERADYRPRAFGRLAPRLDDAAKKRHAAEVLLATPGFAPRGLLDQALVVGRARL